MLEAVKILCSTSSDLVVRQQNKLTCIISSNYHDEQQPISKHAVIKLLKSKVGFVITLAFLFPFVEAVKD